MIDWEAMQVLNRACTQKIILAVYKIVCGKKGQEEKIFQCYVVQGVGTVVSRIKLTYRKRNYDRYYDII